LKFSRGFFLLELILAVGLFSLILSVGTFGFQKIIANQLVRSEAQLIFHQLHLAKALAMAGRKRVAFELNQGYSKLWDGEKLLYSYPFLPGGERDDVQMVLLEKGNFSSLGSKTVKIFRGDSFLKVIGSTWEPGRIRISK